MGDYNKNYSKDDHKNGDLPQYGKKGHKPRVPYSRKNISLDEIRTNDISYWNKTSNYSNVSKFNWDLIIGNARNTSGLVPTRFVPTVGALNPSQIMTLRVIMGPGWAQNVGDGVNRSLAQLMAKIRANLSTSNIGFETADLGIMLASTSSIAALIGYAKRILECYTMWKDRNYAFPRALIKAQGGSYTDIMTNINTYTSRLNASIDMYNNMSLLDCFDIFDRQYSMMHNVFVDEDSQYGQLYMFTPGNYYVYDDTVTPAKARSVKFQPYTMTNFGQLIDMINTAINAWYGSSDLYQINGTLLRAFKDAPRQVIPHHSIENSISPVVDRAFLMQIMNCTIHEVEEISDGMLDITQDPTAQNFLIWTPASADQTQSYVDNSHVLLRLFEDDISNDDNMELTRLVNFVSAPDEMPWFYLQNCGSEIVTEVRCWQYDSTRDAADYTNIFSNYLVLDPTDPITLTLTLEKIGSLQPFRYIPGMHLLRKATPTEYSYEGFLGDVYNWMLYSKVDWEQLQFVAYQSLWTPKNGI